jgi:hypothetical protein
MAGMDTNIIMNVQKYILTTVFFIYNGVFTFTVDLFSHLAGLLGGGGGLIREE